MNGIDQLCVLVVDDNPQMREIVSSILIGLGVRDVREATDGARALEILREWPANLIILDFKMAPMDGVTLTRRIRQAPDKSRYLPIIMMTGHTQKARVVEARDAGVTELVVKPLTGKAIVDRIEAILQRPRPFVQAGGYFGPDRRRRQDPDYMGPMRRTGEPQHVAPLRDHIDL
jgi:two-component system chemotaxis response regulator CheY